MEEEDDILGACELFAPQVMQSEELRVSFYEA
jgi:hypothetical protein